MSTKTFATKLAKNMGAACFIRTDSVKIFDVTDSARIYDTVADEYDYIKPLGTITAEFDEKCSVYILNICLDKFYKKTIRLWPSGAFSPSPKISSSEFDYVSDYSF